jgi:Ca2+-binding EF-hand superfamily protein
MSGYRLFAAIVLLATVQPALAQEPDAARLEAVVLVSKRASTAKTVEQFGNDLLREFRRLDYDGGGISAEERRFQREQLLATYRAIRTMTYLGGYLDGDGTVRAAEWNQIMRAAAHSKLVGRKGVDTPPSESEIEAEIRARMQKLREDYGDPDLNGDGNFTIEEIREGVSATLPDPDDPRVHGKISSAFDRDGDDIVSEAEFMSAISPVLSSMDEDGDGNFSRDETMAFYKEVGPARRELKALRNREAEAMGFGTERRLPGLTWP